MIRWPWSKPAAPEAAPEAAPAPAAAPAGGDAAGALAAFLARLRALSDDELAFVLAFATHERRRMERAGALPLHPAQELRRNPRAIEALAAEIAALPPAAPDAGGTDRALHLGVWLHSLAAGAPGAPAPLRAQGRALWAELARGVDLAGAAAMEAPSRGLPEPDISGCERVPDGLKPDDS